MSATRWGAFTVPQRAWADSMSLNAMASPAARAGSSSAQGAEELADVAGEQVGGVVGSPVAAAVEPIPGDDVGVVAFGEPADRAEVEGNSCSSSSVLCQCGGEARGAGGPEPRETESVVIEAGGCPCGCGRGGDGRADLRVLG
jgi:hypothetical protein